MFEAWNRRGLIPGPRESREGFTARLKLASPVELPLELQPALDRLEALYGVRPDWVQVTFDKKGLAPWQGGATWIDTRTAVRSIALQLRPSKLYGKVELLAHELAHAARLSFDEPQFEEHLAYGLSDRAYRRLLGPILQRPWEAYLLLAGALTAPFTPLPLLALSTLALFRLSRRRRQLRRAHRNLRPLLGDRALHLLYRLTDQEITHFASCSDEQIRRYMAAAPTFRWEFLRHCYFSK